MNKVGVLITNLGTPNAPTAKAVRVYLKEFLSDTRVVNLPKWLWQIILHLVILPIRPKKSAKAYQAIWHKDGSPLLNITQAQTEHIRQYLNDYCTSDISIEFGMRYGYPSLQSAVEKLEKSGVNKLIVLPLYPQYSATTTASTFDKITDIFKQKRIIPHFIFIRDYHDNKAYIDALANQIRRFWDTNGQADKLLLSFHGLPDAHIKAGDIYHQQCQTTAKLLCKALDLNNDEWLISFQSRLGRAKWLEPYTDKTLRKLAKNGTKSIQVICPGFSADCLETLEEIAITNKQLFLKSGGREYDYIPCLNTGDAHIKMLSGLILDN